MMRIIAISILLGLSFSVHGQTSPKPSSTFAPQDLLELFSEGFGEKYSDYTLNPPSITVTRAGTEIISFPREECFGSNLVFEIRRDETAKRQKAFVTIKCVIDTRFDYSILRIGKNLVPLTVAEIVNFQLPPVQAQEELIVTYPETGLKITVLHPRSGYTRMNYELRSYQGYQKFYFTETQAEDGSWLWEYEAYLEAVQQRSVYRMESRPVGGRGKLFESEYFVNGRQVFFPREFFSDLEEIYTIPIKSYFDFLSSDSTVISLPR